MKILVAEDDPHTRQGLIDIFRKEGYATLEASDGAHALEVFGKERPDVVCLDIMMPSVDGYEVCRLIRARNQTVPIVFISAKSEEIDTVLGLELGADDFIVKPFGVKAVVARIRAVTRRCMKRDSGGANYAFEMDDLRVVPAELRAYRGDKIVELSLRDTRILELLYQNKGCAVDRDTLFDECWGLGYMPGSRSLDQHISQLRKRVEKDPAHPRIIKTVHGVGYRYED